MTRRRKKLTVEEQEQFDKEVSRMIRDDEKTQMQTDSMYLKILKQKQKGQKDEQTDE